MYRTHTIKLNYQFAEAVLFGDKNFEIRLNDRVYQKGDYVKFKVVDIPERNPNSEAGKKAKRNDKRIVESIEKKTYEITYVISGWGLKDGYVVFGISEFYEDGKDDSNS